MSREFHLLIICIRHRRVSMPLVQYIVVRGDLGWPLGALMGNYMANQHIFIGFFLSSSSSVPRFCGGSDKI